MRTHVNLAREFSQYPILRYFLEISSTALLYTHNLLLGVLVGGEQVDGLHLAEVDVVAEEEDEEQLAHILLLLVAVQRLVPLSQEVSQK